MKSAKKKIILLTTILILLSLFLISNLMPKLGEDAGIGGKAVLDKVSLSIEIIYTEEQTAGESGNVTFSDPDPNRKVTAIEGLGKDMKVNYTSYGNTFPQGWDEPEPAEDEVETVFKYFSLDASNSTEETYKVYFNITKDALGTADPNDIRLYIYEAGWNELPTTVVSNSDSVRFYAIATHFSNFLIGEKAAEAPSEEPSAGGGSSGGGKKIKEEEKPPEPIAPITGELMDRPAYLMDVSTRILDEYKSISPGGKVLMEVTLYNLGTEEIKDVVVRYCIETSDKTIIKCNEETVAIYTKVQLVKEFLISEGTEAGEYFIKTIVNYNNSTAQSETSFEVILKEPELEKPSPIIELPPQIFIVIGIVILFTAVLALILWKQKGLKEQLQAMKRQITKSRTRKVVQR